MDYKNVLLFSLISLSLSLEAQEERKEISHYILPEFTNGTVLMKNGTKHQALLNYNTVTEEMIFDQNGEKLALAEVTLNQLDTVFIQDRKFILIDNKKFAEIIGQNGYSLLVQYKCRVIPPGKPSAYGGTSQTTSTTSYSSWMGEGKMYQLKLPDDFKINPYKVYWIDKGAGRKSFSSMGQIKKFYNKQKALYNNYTKDNKVDFGEQESIAGLIHYMETNSR
ncbi:hypothetical protein [uncultured Proteiniphilum sp.]|uniref:hypothetical protein n=1 Tax=uncultured Proteiniphilum sp. TaxID=497637 RepID=UPI00261AB871|nr:hypothetical protein [uncultured Proteiniphilum sp.]